MPKRTRIINATLYCPEPTRATQITFAGNRIVAVGDSSEPADEVYDGTGCVVSPGLIDALVHGGGGKPVLSGSVEDVRAVARAHGIHGTTAICGGTFAMPMDRLRVGLRAVAEAALDWDGSGARVLGPYVEGKFGSSAKRGAHAEEHLAAPTIEAFLDLWEASRHTVRVFSYAVENDAGFALTRYLSERFPEIGVVPTMGHTNADYDTACRAIDAGIRRATHLFNGMSGIHHRDMGVAEAVLDDDRVHAELIGDCRHVSPTWSRMATRLKGPRNASLITDAGSAAAIPEDELQSYFEPDPQSGRLVTRTGRRVFLIDGALYLDREGRELTGGCLTLSDAVRRAVDWGTSVSDAVRMATLTPAESLGLTTKGRLASGFDADVAVFDAQWRARAVFVEGSPLVNALPRIR